MIVLFSTQTTQRSRPLILTHPRLFVIRTPGESSGDALARSTSALNNARLSTQKFN